MTPIIGTFFGGLGLFLLAVSMITDGLQLAAGDTLRDVLARFTRTPLRGVASGVLVTGVVQSSSAVTVATIGFVNAGLLSLDQSLGVVYGANVGTTVTGWIVALVGFNVNVEGLALPLIGAGMLARVVRPTGRIAPLGEALAGFGLFFIGVDVLRGAFEVFANGVDVASYAPQSGFGVLLYVLLGFGMTLITQSSSAAIAITLTAATGGVLGLEAAAGMVIGANLGTTSTAALAVIGATANARRVAAAHIVFNLLTGIVAFSLLPGMLWSVRETETILGLGDVPAVSLALFHTVFNLLGLALMWPLTRRLAAFLGGRFTTPAERIARPRYLDRNVRATPALAVHALELELLHASALARECVAAAIAADAAPGRAALEKRRGVLGLLVAIMRPPARQAIADFRRSVLDHLRRCDAEATAPVEDDLQAAYERLQAQWHALKSTLLEAAAGRTIPVARLNAALECLRTDLKIAEQLTKTTLRLRTLASES
jgi:phosphate:Na+ symporter